MGALDASVTLTATGNKGLVLLKYGPWAFPLHGDPRWEALLNDPKSNAPLF